MKVFQVLDGICYYQMPYHSASEAEGKYSKEIQIIETPDNVFEGWGYLDGVLIKPTPPIGWLYDEATGTLYMEGTTPPQAPATDHTGEVDALKAKLTATDYKAIKYAEGWITEAEYAPIKAERQGLRDEINRLEGTL